MYIVGRPLHGTSLNGLEYLLNDDGTYKKFKDIKSAKEFLLEHAFPDATDEELEDYFQFLDESEVNE